MREERHRQTETNERGGDIGRQTETNERGGDIGRQTETDRDK